MPYDNGTLGVGATLTSNSTNVSLTHDGITAIINDRILISGQTNTFENGIYVMTTVENVGVEFILTRSSDYDVQAELIQGSLIFISDGTLNAGKLFVQYSETNPVVGTDSILYTTIASPLVLSQGLNLDISNNVISTLEDVRFTTLGLGTTGNKITFSKTSGGTSYTISLPNTEPLDTQILEYKTATGYKWIDTPASSTLSELSSIHMTKSSGTFTSQYISFDNQIFLKGTKNNTFSRNIYITTKFNI
jgi:hypothetical protein